jgi:predicted acyl esterase
MKAKPRDFQPATITIHSGPVQDSALELPVIGTP